MLETITTGATLVSTAKKIFELVGDAKNLADKASSMELQKFLLQLQQEALDLQAENMTLKTHIQGLENTKKLQTELAFKNGVYWKNGEGPFCQRCQDADEKLIRLQDWHDCWHCTNCKQSYYTKQNPKDNSGNYAETDYDPLGS